MKPILSKAEDENCLEALGRASQQIVHDLKNQLNGLKLYATFLRKRFEKAERPEDEMETVHKLIAGIDRAAEHLSLLTEYTEPLTLRKRAGVDLQQLLNGLNAKLANTDAGPLVVNEGVDHLLAEVDPMLITDALTSISKGALKLLGNGNTAGPVTIELSHENREGSDKAVFHWRGVRAIDHDPFRSFAGAAEIQMAIGARIIEAHGGSAEKISDGLRVTLPVAN